VFFWIFGVCVDKIVIIIVFWSFNEYYARRFEQGYPDLDSSCSYVPNDIPLVDKEDAVIKEDNIHVKFESCFKNGIGNDDSDDYADGAEFGSYEWVVNVTTSIA